MELMRASNQLMTRPDDQKFWTLDEMYRAVKAYRENSRTTRLNVSELRVDVIDGQLRLLGKNGIPAEMTYWSFGQLSQRAGCGSATQFLRSIPPTLAAQNLNYGLKHLVSGNREAQALVSGRDEELRKIRALTGPDYTRIWNEDVLAHMWPLQADGWRVPPAYAFTGKGPSRVATAEDAAVSLTIHEGDLIAPAGLYASEEDMFVFMVHPENVIRDGSAEGMKRGFFISNSEVGKASFSIQMFYHRGVCGNHIVWGASEVKQVRLRHVGEANEKAFEAISVQLKEYADASSGEIETRIAKAQHRIIGKTAKEVVDFIFKNDFMSRTDAQGAYDANVPDVDGDPVTVWGFVQGVTRYSQKQTNADKRTELDRTAGKIMDLVF